jgi:hypothetical protein
MAAFVHIAELVSDARQRVFDAVKHLFPRLCAPPEAPSHGTMQCEWKRSRCLCCERLRSTWRYAGAARGRGEVAALARR